MLLIPSWALVIDPSVLGQLWQLPCLQNVNSILLEEVEPVAGTAPSATAVDTDGDPWIVRGPAVGAYYAIRYATNAGAI